METSTHTFLPSVHQYQLKRAFSCTVLATSAMGTSHSDVHTHVVLLLGAPGVGKSTLGKLLQRTHAATVDAFVNVGDQLRATGKVERHLRDPTAASKLERIWLETSLTMH
jgi:signal recognition particle GTPase